MELRQAGHLRILWLLATFSLSASPAAAQGALQVETKNGRFEEVEGFIGGPPAPKRVGVQLKDAKGRSIGTADIVPLKTGGVKISLDLKGLPPGPYVSHLHEYGACEPPEFASSGGRFDPGKIDPSDNDAHGFVVQANGKAKESVTYSEVSIELNPRTIPVTASGPQYPPPPDNSVFSNGGNWVCT